jgi:hypothetical protein
LQLPSASTSRWPWAVTMTSSAMAELFRRQHRHLVCQHLGRGPEHGGHPVIRTVSPFLDSATRIV